MLVLIFVGVVVIGIINCRKKKEWSFTRGHLVLFAEMLMVLLLIFFQLGKETRELEIMKEEAIANNTANMTLIDGIEKDLRKARFVIYFGH